MSLKPIAAKLALGVLTGVSLLVPASAHAWWGFGCCDCEKCPPPYVHCQPGPPHLKYKHACPKPVCGPCELEGWGYYQNCWRPWPLPPNFARCGVPGPAAVAPPGPLAAPEPRKMPATELLPLPQAELTVPGTR